MSARTIHGVVREDSGQLLWRLWLLDNGLRPSVNRPVLNRSVTNRSVINPFHKELPMAAVKELQRKVRENGISPIRDGTIDDLLRVLRALRGG
jgi:hypothetical protein